MKKYPVCNHAIRPLHSRILAALAVCVILFISIFAIPVSAQSDTVRFENISTEQGLSQSTVNTIIQDQRGFLWFATEGGLDQYDGFQFTAYQHDPDNSASLSNDIVNSLFADQDGYIWIGTGTGLDRFELSSGKFVHYDETLTGSDILDGKSIDAITEDQSGLLWIGTGGEGLVSLDTDTHHVTGYKNKPGDLNSLSSDTVNTIHISRNGELWIGTESGLDRFDPQTKTFAHPFKISTGSSALDDVSVRSIFEDASNVMWIGSMHGLIRWDRVANRYVQYRHDPDVPQSLSDDSVKSVYRDTQGTLWVGTLRGLNQFDETQHSFIHFLHDPNDPYSMSSDYIRSIFEDRSGVLWIGTSFGGLNKYAHSTQKFILYNIHPGLPNNLSDNNIWSVYEDQSGNLWIGTFFLGLNKLDPHSGNVTIYQNDPTNPESLSGNEIRAILQDRNGMLWIGMENGGLNRYDPATGTFTRYQNHVDDPASLSSDHVFSIFEDHLGRLWVGTEDTGLDRYDPASGTFVRYQNNPNDAGSLSNDDVRAIYEDHTGALWIGTFGGLNLWNGQGNQFTAYRHDLNNPASLSNDMVLSVLEDKRGTLWVGTFGGGLNRFNRSDQTFTHFTHKNGLPDDTIYGILGDADDNLWLSTNKGISKFNPQAGTFRNYDISDGLQGNQFNPGAYFQSQGGEMFFGGVRGFNAFFPRQVKDNPIPPQVVITAVRKYNQTIQTDLASNATLQLSYRDNFISFEFAALDYNAPEKNQYAYMLEGVDKDWVQAGTRNYASYTNLAGGNYTFRVKAANNDGIWNPNDTAIHIHIIPPFWQTWWFIGIVCLVAGAGAFGGYRLRVRGIEARNRELVNRVEQRTHELATLNTISEVVNRSLDLTEILNAALEKTIEVMRMDGGLAYRLEETGSGTSDGPLLRLLAHRGVADEYVNIVKVLPLNATFIRETVKTGKPDVRLVNNHPNPQIRKAIEQARVRLAINVPLLVQGKLVGALTLATWEMREITQEELSLLMAISQPVGMAVVNAQLYEQAEQTAITTERSRLARELHDSVTQLLYSVTLYAEAASELLKSGNIETAAGHLHELRDTAQEALREMRLLIFELHSPAPEQGGLAAALQARLDAVERRGGMHADLQVEGSEQIPPQVQAELYNIAHESLNNALKHAHANSVQIRLLFSDLVTEMQISDDGVGFEPSMDGKAGGFGIPGMQERAHKIGGTFQIESAPGRGTRVNVTVPAQHTERSNHA